ncbi:MAG: glycosyltransferase, partial [Nanoarchaeota archaeon]
TNSLEGIHASIDDLVVTETGMLVPPRNADKLAEVLERLIKNPEQRQQMGEKGRQFVVENFSWDVVAPQILSVCEKAIATKTQRKMQVLEG